MHISVIDLLIFGFIRDANIFRACDPSSRFIHNPLIRWAIEFSREKYDIATPAEDDTDMVGAVYPRGCGIMRISTPVSDKIETGFWEFENVGF
jgi:hypothetical protein